MEYTASIFRPQITWYFYIFNKTAYCIRLWDDLWRNGKDLEGNHCTFLNAISVFAFSVWANKYRTCSLALKFEMAPRLFLEILCTPLLDVYRSVNFLPVSYLLSDIFRFWSPFLPILAYEPVKEIGKYLRCHAVLFCGQISAFGKNLRLPSSGQKCCNMFLPNKPYDVSLIKQSLWEP